MVSIIICSIDKQAFAAFEKNITSTIGVPFEIIRIDNSSNHYSICSAYNEGTRLAKYEYLCFAHEDISVTTQNWGEKVISIFQADDKLGLIGIAGSLYKSHAPWGWGLIPEKSVINIIQHYKHRKEESSHDVQNPQNGILSYVACIDGVWMCTKKSIAAKIPFDEKTFTNFHCYDLDFSLSVLQTHKVAVTFEILLEHFSEGKNDRAWVIESLKLHRKWKSILPVNVAPEPKDNFLKQETQAVTEFLHVMMEMRFSTWQMLLMLHDNNHIIKEELLQLKIRVIKEWLKKQLTWLPYSVILKKLKIISNK